MLDLKSLEYKNIMAVGNHPIKVDFQTGTTTLIGGLNGSGKSTMVLALVWVLYGKIINGMKISQTVNSNNNKNMMVKCQFVVKGDHWEVVRGEKPKKFEIYRNGDLLDRYANARDQQKFLETVLGMDYKLFTQLVVINKERYIPFMEMGAADRRKIVEDILGISIFSYMNDVTKKRITEQKKTENTIERNVDVGKKELEGQQRLIIEIRTSIEEASGEVESEIKSKKQKMDDLDQQRTELTEKKDTLLDKLEPHAKIKKQLREFDKLSTEFTQQHKQASQHARFFLENDFCPTCGQSIDEQLKQQKKDEAQEKVDSIESTISEMTSELEKIVEKDQEYSDLQDELNEYQSSISQMNSELNYLESDIQRLLKRSEEASKSDKLETCVSEYNQIENALEKQIEDLRDAIEQRELLEMMKDLLKDDGIKSLIVKDYNSVMNQYINQYLHAMGYYINLTIDENFNEKFHSMNKEGFSYQNLSSGQKTRLNLAITLALLQVASVKNSVVCNVMILDELLEPVDKQGISDVMNLFKEKLSTKNVLVVTQRFDEFADKFDNTLEFQLNHDFTELVQ